MEGLTAQNDGAADSARESPGRRCSRWSADTCILKAASGGFATTLQGLCIGFFVPFLPLFFFHTNLFSQEWASLSLYKSNVSLTFELPAGSSSASVSDLA